jgi:hypothetical protein
MSFHSLELESRLAHYPMHQLELEMALFQAGSAGHSQMQDVLDSLLLKLMMPMPLLGLVARCFLQLQTGLFHLDSLERSLRLCDMLVEARLQHSCD